MGKLLNTKNKMLSGFLIFLLIAGIVFCGYLVYRVVFHEPVLPYEDVNSYGDANPLELVDSEDESLRLDGVDEYVSVDILGTRHHRSSVRLFSSKEHKDESMYDLYTIEKDNNGNWQKKLYIRSIELPKITTKKTVQMSGELEDIYESYRLYPQDEQNHESYPFWNHKSK